MNRCYSINEISGPVNIISLHGFSDAPELGYGACIYNKSIRRSGNVNANLVTSKSRVIPMKKKYSIPRLELLGILSKLMVTMLNSLKEEIFIDVFYCYIDSGMALAWILSIDKELKTFCKNCVNIIRRNIDIRKCSYVKYSDNQADIITRFNNYSLNENSLWLKGPGFLYLRENTYTEEISINENDGNVYLEKLRGYFPDVIIKY